MVLNISLSFPHDVPEMALSILFLPFILLPMFLACWLNVSNESSVTPRILGLLMVGTGMSLMEMSSGKLTSFVHVVKIIADCSSLKDARLNVNAEKNRTCFFTRSCKIPDLKLPVLSAHC